MGEGVGDRYCTVERNSQRSRKNACSHMLDDVSGGSFLMYSHRSYLRGRGAE